jgi:hypothetical protein
LSGCVNHFDLAATDEFVTAPAKPSIVQRLPFPESVYSTQKNQAVGSIQSNRQRHFHRANFVGMGAALQSDGVPKS